MGGCGRTKNGEPRDAIGLASQLLGETLTNSNARCDFARRQRLPGADVAVGRARVHAALRTPQYEKSGLEQSFDGECRAEGRKCRYVPSQPTPISWLPVRSPWPSGLLTSRLAFANTNANGKARFIFIILRGALDGLAAVPPYGDRDYPALRRDLVFSANSALPLNDLFGLHPSLVFLKESFTARELVVFHAIASPYRERSHFDGQDVLENGLYARACRPEWLAQPRARRDSCGALL